MDHLVKEGLAFALAALAVIVGMYIFFVAGLDTSAQSTKAKLASGSSS
ncbi:MAG: hypothetical protein JRN62_10080 [Nitrososphaerota archaeon]|jgi:hypothetical protein|nr:hypothetical protein [Nitrososphaerota archaeon]MDG6949812.1 hypothetical protein [Nitrososphaerota archaeon]